MTKIKEINYDIICTSLLLTIPLFSWYWGRHQPAWILMWVLAFTLYATCKVLTLLHFPSGAGWKAGWVYSLAWPGMDPESFLQKRPPGGNRNRTRLALRNIAVGGICLGVFAPEILKISPLTAGWVGMTGLIFILHFGCFDLLSMMWISRGYNAKPIMNRPLEASSLSNFWGQRWNRAFQCLTKRYIFRPLVPRIGAEPALGFSFLFSGLIHEWVITLPAGGGYGGPTFYFLLQGFGMKLERSFKNRINEPLKRIWTLGMVVLPAGLLFPPVFVRIVILPMFAAWGIFPEGSLK